jgi:hypothetical protein
MLVHDLVKLAECGASFIALCTLVEAWRNRHLLRHRTRPRRCLQCRGHLLRLCRACNGTGRALPRGRTRPDGHA